MFRVFCFEEITKNLDLEKLTDDYLLLGVRDGKTICITDVINGSFDDVNELLDEHHHHHHPLSSQNRTNENEPTTSSPSSCRLEIVGVVVARDEEQKNVVGTLVLKKQNRKLKIAPFITMTVNKNEENNNNHFTIRLYCDDDDHDKLSTSSAVTNISALVFYDRNEFACSCLIDSRVMSEPDSCISIIHHALVLSQHAVKYLNKKLSSSHIMEDDCEMKFREFGFVANFSYIIFLYVISFTDFFIPSISFPSIPVISLPSIVKHVLQKYSEVHNLVTSVNHHPTRFNQLRFKNFLCLTLIDTFVGVVIMNLFLQPDQLDELASILLSAAEWIGDRLEQLIFWLQNNPAGLKLNGPLTNFLSHFFLYHVFLWKAYLALLIPVLSSILRACVLSGIFGLTMQCCIMRDLLSIMTLHVYCFYVYAAKLYSLQLVALKPLCRLFMGKKFNRLKLRVDSVEHVMDAMFVGTLIFTILFFILPTTLVFYIVFLALRLTTLMLHVLMSSCIVLLNNVHIYWLYVRCFTGCKLKCLTKVQVRSYKPLCFKLNLQPLNLLELIKLSSSFSSSPTSSPSPAPSQSSFPPSSASASSSSSMSSSMSSSVKSFVKKCLTGDLIYPWIDKQNKLMENY
ncbi:hypothetical protein HELRODRAFT_112528 [Helobdella robusta]|uniref:Phosphatidylinositol N-acetylglucosaminyltransferase subunit Q n=1 Tax=Helobdella robusta TaxID=6412 RepID=T1EFK5_HELRO|nr:hypothetical protein HELRODRAFT_112528 [Helobdella robusta]ESO01524.1 hypothetical protein HELRODRAFT_112528 [Helobdella robusta]